MLADLDRIPLADLNGYIVFGDQRAPVTGTQFHWRPCVVPNYFATVPPSNGLYNSIVRQQEQILAGMKYAWFTLAMLNVDYASLAFLGEGPHYYDSFYRPMLHQFRHWYAAIVRILPRIAFDFKQVLNPYSEDFDSWSMLWAVALRMACACKVRERDELSHTIWTKYGSNIAIGFEREGILEM